MNKMELINKVAKETKLTKPGRDGNRRGDAREHHEGAEGGDEVRLVGFGTFTVSRRKASEGRNPRTGEPIKIPRPRIRSSRPARP